MDSKIRVITIASSRSNRINSVFLHEWRNDKNKTNKKSMFLCERLKGSAFHDTPLRSALVETACKKVTGFSFYARTTLKTCQMVVARDERVGVGAGNRRSIWKSLLHKIVNCQNGRFRVTFTPNL